MQHQFTMTLQWQGGRNAVGELQAEQLQTAISIPTTMQGPGIGTNPDEMLLGAASTCYIITLATLLENAKVTVAKITMQAQGFVSVVGGVYTYERLHYEPQLTLVDASQHKLALRLVAKAEKTCMISKALAGNVAITLAPIILYKEN